jgi:hypothetical protein
MTKLLDALPRGECRDFVVRFLEMNADWRPGFPLSPLGPLSKMGPFFVNHYSGTSSRHAKAFLAVFESVTGHPYPNQLKSVAEAGLPSVKPSRD